MRFSLWRSFCTVSEILMFLIRTPIGGMCVCVRACLSLRGPASY